MERLLASLDEEKYRQLQRAVELGKWPDGRRVDDEERATALQVLIAYDSRHKPEEERIGYIAKPETDVCETNEADVHTALNDNLIARD